MKHKYLFSIPVFLFFSKLSFGQTAMQLSSGIKAEKVTLSNVQQKVVGTFEIIQFNNKRTYVLSNQVLLDIENRRDDNKEVLYQPNSNIKIRILPRSVINAPGFVPIKNEQN